MHLRVFVGRLINIVKLNVHTLYVYFLITLCQVKKKYLLGPVGLLKPNPWGPADNVLCLTPILYTPGSGWDLMISGKWSYFIMIENTNATKMNNELLKMKNNFILLKK